jgi:hypothetical protein
MQDLRLYINPKTRDINSGVGTDFYSTSILAEVAISKLESFPSRFSVLENKTIT